MIPLNSNAKIIMYLYGVRKECDSSLIVIVKAVGISRMTVLRMLEDLTTHGLTEKFYGNGMRGHKTCNYRLTESGKEVANHLCKIQDVLRKSGLREFKCKP